MSHILHVFGRSEEALAESGNGVARAESGNVRVMVPEIYRIRGDIYADLDRHREADEAYATAVSSAKDQGAVSLELRALTSLLSHRLAHGDAQSTRSELQTLVASIPVSPDRPDMIAARALLIESRP
jgi:hypothetical protein